MILRGISLAFLLIFLLTLPALSKESWNRLRSANFTLVGSSSPAELRRIADRLEEFRETLRRLAPAMSVKNTTPVTVVVFDSEASYRPYKPKRSDGRIDQDVAGFFQSGEDANYITLASDTDDELFQTFYHEYVHFIVSDNFGRTEVPPWLNEGIAEYYQTVSFGKDRRAVVGSPRAPYADLLNGGRLMPVEQLVGTSNAQLRAMEPAERLLFYGESWALVHLILQGSRPDRMALYIRALMSGERSRAAFASAIAEPFQQADRELQKYVAHGRYKTTVQVLTGVGSEASDTVAEAIPEAEAEAYLGDLLYHMQRDDEAESHLAAALREDPHSALANKALGLLRLKQRRFEEAKKYLGASLSGGLESAVVSYRYADLVGRADMDDLGYVYSFRKENADKMRTALRKAIALDPGFVDAYERLAFIDLVNGEELDDALSALATAQRLAPRDGRLTMRIADIYFKQHRYDGALKIVEEISSTAQDGELRQRASALKKSIEDIRTSEKTASAVIKTVTPMPVDIRPQQLDVHVEERPPTEAELEKMNAENELRGTNISLRPPSPGEQRVIGRVARIACKGAEITYPVRSASGEIALSSPDFKSVHVAIFRRNASRARLGCGESLEAYNSVLTYRPPATPQQHGTLVSIEFVSDDFRFMTEEESKIPPPRIVPMEPPVRSNVELPSKITVLNGLALPDDSARDEALRTVRDALRKPGDGEVRDSGYLKGIECTGKGAIYHIATSAGELLLRPADSDTVPVRIFTPDLAALNLNCRTKAIEYPVIFIYKKTGENNGPLVSLEFVPRSFSLVP